MKYLFTLALSLCLTQLSIGQTALHDAILLREYLDAVPYKKTVAKFKQDPESRQAIFNILWKYVPKNGKSVEDEFFDNPYLSPDNGAALICIPDNFQDISSAKDREYLLSTGTPSPGMFVTNLADGLAGFLVKRTKQELTAAFFRDFQRKMRDNCYLKILFPETTQTLEVIGEEIYQFNNYLGALRNSYIQDLNVLPSNLQKGIEQQGWIENTVTQLLAKDLLEVGQMLVDGNNPQAFLAYLAGDRAAIQDTGARNLVTDTAAKRKLDNLAGSFKLIHLVSGSLLEKPGSEDWMSRQEIERALRDRWTLYIYLGLLYQQGADIRFSKVNFRDALRDVAGKATTLDRIVTQTALFAENGRTMRDRFKKLGSNEQRDSANYESYYSLFNSVFRLMEAGVQVRSVLIPGDTSDFTENHFINDLRQLNNLNLNIRQKQYVLAVGNLTYLLGRLLEGEFNEKTKSSFLKYSMFIASVAEADTPEAMQTAIELFAMPPGSSTLKKHAAFSFSLNAYTGPAYGVERLERAGTSNIVSITAPVGVGLNWGLGKRRGSLSFFSPIIDVGAITAYRFNNDNTEQLPALEWSNILAPGAFLVYGCGWDVPVALGFGAQMGPNLRKVNVGGVPDIADRGWRFQAFLAVDIPIAHFYTRK
jgi:hypothetical protein